VADVLVDTSVWVEYLRHGSGTAADLLDELLRQRRVALCGMVALELLQGARESERARLDSLLKLLPFVASRSEDYWTAGERLNLLRRKGNLLPPADGLIAALCINNGLSLLTLDKHFAHFHDLKRMAIQAGS
jgi:hypothetical protein